MAQELDAERRRTRSGSVNDERTRCESLADRCNSCFAVLGKREGLYRHGIAVSTKQLRNRLQLLPRSADRIECCGNRLVDGRLRLRTAASTQSTGRMALEWIAATKLGLGSFIDVQDAAGRIQQHDRGGHTFEGCQRRSGKGLQE